jgi:hypothetical protein
MTGFKRTSARKPFTMVSNELAQNDDVSMECLALMVYLLSKPDGWKGRPIDIERRTGWKKKKRRAAIIEAEKLGYLAFRKVRDPQTGRFDQYYEVFDDPLPESERTQSWNTGKRESPTPKKETSVPGSLLPTAVKETPYKESNDNTESDC